MGLFLTSHGNISCTVCSCRYYLLLLVFTVVAIVCQVTSEPHSHWYSSVYFNITIFYHWHILSDMFQNRDFFMSLHQVTKFSISSGEMPWIWGDFSIENPLIRKSHGPMGIRRGFDAGDLASTQEEIASERELRSWWEQRSGDLATQATVNGCRWKRFGKQKWEVLHRKPWFFTWNIITKRVSRIFCP